MLPFAFFVACAGRLETGDAFSARGAAIRWFQSAASGALPRAHSRALELHDRNGGSLDVCDVQLFVIISNSDVLPVAGKPAILRVGVFAQLRVVDREASRSIFWRSVDMQTGDRLGAIGTGSCRPIEQMSWSIGLDLTLTRTATSECSARWRSRLGM